MPIYSKEQWKEKYVRETRKAGITGCTLGALLTAKRESKGRQLQESAINELLESAVVFRIGQQRASRGALILSRVAVQALMAKAGPADQSVDGVPGPVSVTALESAYGRLVERTRFADVRLSALAEEMGCSPGDIEPLIRSLAREGRAVLSFGDWALANETERAAAITIRGDRYLLVRLER